jgi:hypothetical protein
MEFALGEIQTARSVHERLRKEIARCAESGIILGDETDGCEQGMAAVQKVLDEAEGIIAEVLALARIALERTEADEQAEFEAADLKIGGRSHGRN